MVPASASQTWSLSDGLGTRAYVSGRPDLEVLTVTRELARDPFVDDSARDAARRLAGARLPAVARIYSIDRDGSDLRIVAEAPSGVRLSDLLAGFGSGDERLDDAAALEVAAAVVKTVAAMHLAHPGLSHGAITPDHIVFTENRGCVLTDAIFGGVLEGLQRNRHTLWRHFRVALPPSATGPRFDQRGDVTQLAAVVLAILLRRTLWSDEYPVGIPELVTAVTPDSAPHGIAVRRWLEQALQLHPTFVFESAVAASRAFSAILGQAGIERKPHEAFSFLARPATMSAGRCGVVR